MLEQKINEVFGDAEPSGFGSGWWSGVLSAFFGILAFGAVVCLHFPQLLTSPELRPYYPMDLMRKLIQGVIVGAIVLGVISAMLRRKKVLALTGLTLEHREGEKIAYRKVDAVTAFDAKPYVGRFCGVDTFACLSFKQQGDTLTYSGPRWYNTPLSPAYADVFTGEAAPGAGRITVKFERDASGAVTALRFGEGRAYDVAFRRVAD